MFSAIATTTPRVSYSSKLDVWMVFCVIFVFGTLLEFTFLIFLQKHIFATRLKGLMKRSYTSASFKAAIGPQGSIRGAGHVGGYTAVNRSTSSMYCHRGGSASQNTILTTAPASGATSQDTTATGGGGMCRGTSTNTFIDGGSIGGNSGCRNNSNYVDGVVCNADSSNSTTADQSRLMLAALNAGIRGPDPVSTSAVSSCSGSTRRRRCYDPRTHVMM